MDDIVLLADLQRAAQVDAQMDDFSPGEGMVLTQIIGDRRQQLHPDEDIPTQTILVGEQRMILVADNVAVALEFAHQGDLPVQVTDIIPEIGGRPFPVHAVG